MKKYLPLIIIAVVAVSAWYFSASTTVTPSSSPAPGALPTVATGKAGAGAAGHQEAPAATDHDREGMINDINDLKTHLGVPDGDDEGLDAEPVKPAIEVYKSADEALKKVKEAATDYDDITLEQFTNPDPSCAWCGEFYKSVKDLMLAGDTKGDQRSYYAELLAVSGRTENLAALIEAIKTTTNQEQRDVYAQALELATGKEGVVKFLGEQLSQASSNPQLKESLIASLTNQGTRLAAETLFKSTVENGDPEGYYQQGIGLGEFVPDQETLPYLQDLVTKRDAYSHLALKAMLNSGLPGLRMAVDSLTNSKDPEFDKKMLKNAADHVGYDEETETFLKQVVANSKDSTVVEFAKNILDSFKTQDEPVGDPSAAQ